MPHGDPSPTANRTRGQSGWSRDGEAVPPVRRHRGEDAGWRTKSCRNCGLLCSHPFGNARICDAQPDEAKDALDIYFCVRNYPGGIDQLATDCQDVLGQASGQEG